MVDPRSLITSCEISNVIAGLSGFPSCKVSSALLITIFLLVKAILTAWITYYQVYTG